MNEVVFVTHNKGKIAEAQKILTDIKLDIFEHELDEPRSDDVKYISKCKVMEAFKIVNKPCISMDAGFWIDELNCFPKAFVNFSLETVGIDGILKLMEGKDNRACRFIECLSYYDGKELHQFMGKHEGTIAYKIAGNDTNKKWSDLWYIYKPYGYDKTLAEMSEEERNNRKKYNSTNSIRLFADWYRNQCNFS